AYASSAGYLPTSVPCTRSAPSPATGSPRRGASRGALAGEGWGGGARAPLSLVASPLPIPPPSTGGGSAPNPPPHASHHRLMALDADAQDLVGIARPPIVGGENFDLAVAAIARRLHQRADRAQVDHAVAHHAAVEQEVGGREEPVVDVVGENFFSG